MAAALELEPETRKPEVVRDLIARAPLVVGAEESVLWASEQLGDSPSRAAVVLDAKGTVIGILATGRLIAELARMGSAAAELTVADLVQRDVPRLRPDVALRKAWLTLGKVGSSYGLVVSEGGVCIGPISQSELRDHAFDLLEACMSPVAA